MTGAVRGIRGPGARRRPAVPTGLVLAALLLTACPSPAARDDADATHRTARPIESGLSAPVTAVPDDGQATTEPAVTVDLALGSAPGAHALDVSGTFEGGAGVLVGESPSGRAPHIVLVSADGRRTGPIAVPGLASAEDLHGLPEDSMLVTGRLADEEALGYAVLDPATGAARTVAAVPLDEATSRAAAASTVSPDGRTVWLFSTMLVDGRFQYLLTAHDVATGEPVAARDLFPELRAIHLPEQELELVGLARSAEGGVVLAVNAYPRETSPFARPLVLAYDAALEPVGDPVPLSPPEALVTARALTTSADGTTFVVLRGPTHSWLVALPPDGRGPEPLLEMSGFGFTDELVLDADGRAVLPGRLGARTVDLSTGATTDIDLGCAGVVTVRAFESPPRGGTWILGGCLEESRLRPVLWWIA